MRNRIDEVFQELKKQRKKALIGYLAAGYPGLAEQTRLIQTLEEAGMDILEIGVPFSDPIADGPTIQFASQESLRRGTTLKKILRWVGSLRSRVRLPIVLMSYLNPILKFGGENFARQAAAAGVQGLIVPDLIPEEAGELAETLRKRGVHLIFLAAPTTPPHRQKMIAVRTGGFLYAVSVTGVTGARASVPTDAKAWLKRLSNLSPRPVCVGFGISAPKHVRTLKGAVDGCIVGSALIELIRKNPPARRPAVLGRFVRALSKECFYGN